MGSYGSVLRFVSCAPDSRLLAIICFIRKRARVQTQLVTKSSTVYHRNSKARDSIHAWLKVGRSEKDSHCYPIGEISFPGCPHGGNFSSVSFQLRVPAHHVSTSVIFCQLKQVRVGGLWVKRPKDPSLIEFTSGIFGSTFLLLFLFSSIP